MRPNQFTDNCVKDLLLLAWKKFKLSQLKISTFRKPGYSN